MQARYLTAYSKSERSLIRNIKKYFDELGAEYDKNVRINPSNNYRIAEANVALNYELSIKVKWKYPASSPNLLTFDIESFQDIDIDKLKDLIEISATSYFSKLTLVYSSCGRSRNLESFPFFFDLENVIRELIITVMISSYGNDWWDTAGIDNRLLHRFLVQRGYVGDFLERKLISS
ncbi:MULTISPECIES: hypothetical protein [unclassified Nostoc]|uniref:hypothetical protein n=1 Tax=unclassified Nostoc TaxID=2593658 RepID=UPI001DE229C5|nr:hypothetical protein [Nostoc sp. JL23]MBN3879583.1 hypothetical protein [Nostoc sp. JL23]